MGTFSRWVKAPPKASQSPRAPHSSPQPRHERSVLISTNAILATKPQMYQPELYQGLTKPSNLGYAIRRLAGHGLVLMA